jgi:hypothetical protein
VEGREWALGHNIHDLLKESSALLSPSHGKEQLLEISGFMVGNWECGIL